MKAMGWVVWTLIATAFSLAGVPTASAEADGSGCSTSLGGNCSFACFGPGQRLSVTVTGVPGLAHGSVACGGQFAECTVALTQLSCTRTTGFVADCFSHCVGTCVSNIVSTSVRCEAF